MFRLRWHQDAVSNLATFWTDSDSELRRQITEASRELDIRLQRNPLTEGESREGDHRILFLPPLVVEYRVDQVDQVVYVLNIRLITPRN